jgi:hypothetical protein
LFPAEIQVAETSAIGRFHVIQAEEVKWQRKNGRPHSGCVPAWSIFGEEETNVAAAKIIFELCITQGGRITQDRNPRWK